MKVRRTTNYLEGAERDDIGRLVLNVEHTSLQQRQDNFSFAMKVSYPPLPPHTARCVCVFFCFVVIVFKVEVQPTSLLSTMVMLAQSLL